MVKISEFQKEVLVGTILGDKGNTEIQYQIYVSGYSYERFVELVNPYIIDSMKYKIPPPRTKTGVKRFSKA